VTRHFTKYGNLRIKTLATVFGLMAMVIASNLSMPTRESFDEYLPITSDFNVSTGIFKGSLFGDSYLIVTAASGDVKLVSFLENGIPDNNETPCCTVEVSSFFSSQKMVAYLCELPISILITQKVYVVPFKLKILSAAEMSQSIAVANREFHERNNQRLLFPLALGVFTKEIYIWPSILVVGIKSVRLCCYLGLTIIFTKIIFDICRSRYRKFRGVCEACGYPAPRDGKLCSECGNIFGS